MIISNAQKIIKEMKMKLLFCHTMILLLGGLNKILAFSHSFYRKKGHLSKKNG